MRIGHSRYTEQLEVTAFHNPDGKLVCALLNRNDFQIPVCLRLNGQIASLALEPESISTVIISEAD